MGRRWTPSDIILFVWIFPSGKQWKSWSLPSKLTAVGAYTTLVAVGLSIAFFLLSHNQEPKQLAAPDKSEQTKMEEPAGDETSQDTQATPSVDSTPVDMGVVGDVIRKYLLPGGRLARGSRQTAPLSESEYLAAFETVRRTAGPRLRSLLRDHSTDTMLLNLDRTVRNYLNTDGETLARGSVPAPGNLTIRQYTAALDFALEEIYRLSREPDR